MIDSSSASARDRSSVVIVDGMAFNPRTRSSISSMSARRTRFALRSPACSGVEMTSSPLTGVYLSRGARFRSPPANISRNRAGGVMNFPDGASVVRALSRGRDPAGRPGRNTVPVTIRSRNHRESISSGAPPPTGQNRSGRARTSRSAPVTRRVRSASGAATTMAADADPPLAPSSHAGRRYPSHPDTTRRTLLSPPRQ
jgi:hypothetical protein